MLGVPPPPIGPRTVSPAVIGAVKEAIVKLLSVVDLERDEGLKRYVDKLVAPLIKHAIQVRHELSEPPKPSRDEAEDSESGPLDRTAAGLPGGGGKPILSALPQLMGLTGT